MNRAFAPTPPDPNAGGIARLAKYLAMAGGRRADALAIAERSETNVHVLGAIKSAAASGVTTDADQEALVNARTLTAAFIPQLRGRSVFYALVDLEALTLVPFESQFGFVTTDASAFVAGEGAAIPVSRMSLGSEVLKPIMAAGIVVLSKDLLEAMGVRGESFLNRELRRAVAAAVDAKFFDALLDDDAPQIESTGSDGDAVGLDLHSLLAAVAPDAESRLVFGLAKDVAARACTAVTLCGAPIFPNLTPTGGTILGAPAIVSEGLAAGTVALVDGAGLVGQSDVISIKGSGDTSIEMQTEPAQDGTTAAGSELVSMFQTGQVAVMARTYFGIAKVRPNAVALLTNVAWGGNPVPS